MKKNFLQIVLLLLLVSYCTFSWEPVHHQKAARPLSSPSSDPVSTAASAASLSSSSDYGEYYFDVFVNDFDEKQVAFFLQDKEKNFWAQAEDLTNWGFELPKTSPFKYQGHYYYPLSHIEGLTYNLNLQSMTIRLYAPARAFKSQHLNANASKIGHFVTPSPGAFFNYNLYGTTTNGSHNIYNGLFELGLFNEYGVGTTTFLLTNQPGLTNAIRLITVFVHDDPNKMESWRLGDLTSAFTNWSGSVNFGGIQYATNFATQPYFLPFPLPGIKGQATVPSAVDLYINGAMTTEVNVQPGTFDVSNIPLIDGSGNIRMVTKDIFGRQQVVSIPYYLSTQLLKKGLSNFSYELGVLRQNLGIESNDYRRLLVAATKSTGLSDTLTWQWHGEALINQQALGIGLTKMVYPIGVFTANIAGSRSHHGNGVLAWLGYQYQTPKFNFGANTQLASVHFTQQAIPESQFAPSVLAQIFTGFTVGNNSFGISWTRQANRNMPSANFILASYSTSFFKEIGLSFTMINSLGGIPNHSAFLSLIHSFGSDESGSDTTLNFTRADDNNARQYTMQLLKSLPPGPGWGYNITANRTGGNSNSSNSNIGSISYQNNIGTYLAQVNTNQGQHEIYSANIMGSVVNLNQHYYLSRSITNSFGVVKVSTFPNVNVYANNLLVGTTNEDGSVLVPNLLPYEDTKIKIETRGLPFDAKIGDTEKYVAPYYLSGIVVPFDVKVTRNAILTVKLASGQVIPQGATVSVEGVKETTVVGLDGEVYLTDLNERNKVTVAWADQQCQFEFTLPVKNPKNPVPDLGSFVCR